MWVFVLKGMVDPGEQVSLTLQREFSEEALNSLEVSAAERAQIHDSITKLFNSAGFQVQPQLSSRLFPDRFRFIMKIKSNLPFSPSGF